jgi:hypothetical protein
MEESNTERYAKLKKIIETLGGMINEADDIVVAIERREESESTGAINIWIARADRYVAECDEWSAIIPYNRCVRRIPPNSSNLESLKQRACVMEEIRPILQRDKYEVAKQAEYEAMAGHIDVSGTSFSLSDTMIKYNGKPIFLDGQNFAIAHLFISIYNSDPEQIIGTDDIVDEIGRDNKKGTVYSDSDIRSLLVKLRKVFKTATGQDQDYFANQGKRKWRFNP